MAELDDCRAEEARPGAVLLRRLVAGVVACPGAGTRIFRGSCQTRAGAAPVPAGRLIVHDDNVRIETPELPDGFFLIDGAKPAAYFVRPAMHLYMDARQSSRLTSWFVPVDPNDPCRQWQAMARLAGAAHPDDLRCERTGEDVIGGRRLIAYRVTAGSERAIPRLDRSDCTTFRCDQDQGRRHHRGGKHSGHAAAGVAAAGAAGLPEIRS